MKRRSILAAVGLTVLGMLGGYWKWQWLPPGRITPHGSVVLVSKLAAGEAPVYLPKPHEPTDDLTEEQRSRLYEKRMERMRQTLEQEDRPIALYGRVLDQHDTPVIGARVKAHVVYHGRMLAPGLMPRQKELSVETDNAGRFAFIDQKGFRIDLESITKDGYAFEYVAALYYTTESFQTGAAGSSAVKPYDVAAYRVESPAEQLIDGDNLYFGIVPDGRVYTIDLIKREKTEGVVAGDLQVAITRLADGTPTNPSPCVVVFRVPGGGLIESQQKMMLQAPADGYQSEWRIDKTPSNIQSGEVGFKKKFYIKSRGGKVYGRLEIDLVPNFGVSNNAALQVNQSINPGGSRNLYSGK